MRKFTKEARTALRKLGVSGADVHKENRTCYGTVYGLYNPFFLIDGVFCGYTQREIYHILAEKLLNRIGFEYPIFE